MNTISKDDVAHIAQLARIHLTPKEIIKFTGELSHILDYVQQLQTVDTRGVPHTAHASGGANVLRDDIVKKQGSDVRDALLDAIPAREGDQVKVKAVFQ
ncbi:Asp-tRNA(Asn)/Glu-tRNA(Gln) amidotransferase subunit GatC [Candidatus Uhrbacteria bacterium]|nr:Asp-tRNA(Asn)/Glu-tRNA(Gln) amidotransferase subunit GatC [Candidatus Uhrbacteria bacterium]